MSSSRSEITQIRIRTCAYSTTSGSDRKTQKTKVIVDPCRYQPHSSCIENSNLSILLTQFTVHQLNTYKCVPSGRRIFLENSLWNSTDTTTHPHNKLYCQFVTLSFIVSDSSSIQYNMHTFRRRVFKILYLRNEHIYIQIQLCKCMFSILCESFGLYSIQVTPWWNTRAVEEGQNRIEFMGSYSNLHKRAIKRICLLCFYVIAVKGLSVSYNWQLVRSVGVYSVLILILMH